MGFFDICQIKYILVIWLRDDLFCVCVPSDLQEISDSLIKQGKHKHLVLHPSGVSFWAPLTFFQMCSSSCSNQSNQCLTFHAIRALERVFQVLLKLTLQLCQITQKETDLYPNFFQVCTKVHCFIFYCWMFLPSVSMFVHACRCHCVCILHKGLHTHKHISHIREGKQMNKANIDKRQGESSYSELIICNFYNQHLYDLVYIHIPKAASAGPCVTSSVSFGCSYSFFLVVFLWFC